MSLPQMLFDIFFKGCTHYATASTSSGNVTYHPVEGQPSLETIQRHLDGEIILGSYTVLPGNMVRWICFDVDSRSDLEKAREITHQLTDYLEQIPYVVEFSGNKGYHILIFLEEETSSSEAKAWGESIRDAIGAPRSGDPHVEVFPKQERLTASNPLGNLLRLPLGKHPATHSKTMFVDPYNGWESGQERDPEKVLAYRASFRDLILCLQEQTPREIILNLLVPYWTSGQRHDMALYTSGYLASLGWTEEGVRQLVEDLHDRVGEGDLSNQLECVKDTFERLYRGESIVGFQGLSEILPSSVLRQLAEQAGKEISSPMLQIIDRIRLGKGAIFLKVRTASRTVISHFKENGNLVKDLNSVYWLDRHTRELFVLGGIGWDRFLHTHFGLNPLDSFGKQVTESVRLYAEEEAQEVTVHKRSFWDGRNLLINLGGPEVYALNGNPSQRRVSLNGENGVLFLNTEDPMRLPNLQQLDLAPISPWNLLVNDISFSTGDSVSATPQQQKELLKAWVLSTFFSEAMPTRPILTILASSGAGKTTTARRILRFLEGPNEDVLGLVQDKPDSFRSSLVAHKILVLDNLEKTKASWLTDMLNRVSTGSHIEVRKLYRTNDVFKIIPDCFVIITATDMPFSEETVFTRMLPLELAPLTSPRPEYQIQVQLLENYNAMWKGLLDDLEEVVQQVNTNRVVEAPNESRLADFTVFCSRIRQSPIFEEGGAALMGGLESLVSRQRQVLQESSPFVQSLEIWLRSRPEEAIRWSNASELGSLLQRVATSNRIEWRWNSGQGLARHISMLESQLIRYYGMSTRVVRESNRELKQYRFERATVNMDSRIEIGVGR